MTPDSAFHTYPDTCMGGATAADTSKIATYHTLEQLYYFQRQAEMRQFQTNEVSHPLQLQDHSFCVIVICTVLLVYFSCTTWKTEVVSFHVF